MTSLDADLVARWFTQLAENEWDSADDDSAQLRQRIPVWQHLITEAVQGRTWLPPLPMPTGAEGEPGTDAGAQSAGAERSVQATSERVILVDCYLAAVAVGIQEAPVNHHLGVEPVVLVAGLLTGAEGLRERVSSARRTGELVAADAAAAAGVDRATDGAGIGAVIRAACDAGDLAAGRAGHGRTDVGRVLGALADVVAPQTNVAVGGAHGLDDGVELHVYRVAFRVPADPDCEDELVRTLTVDSQTVVQVTESGPDLEVEVLTRQPGPAIEAVLPLVLPTDLRVSIADDESE